MHRFNCPLAQSNLVCRCLNGEQRSLGLGQCNDTDNFALDVESTLNQSLFNVVTLNQGCFNVDTALFAAGYCGVSSARCIFS